MVAASNSYSLKGKDDHLIYTYCAMPTPCLISYNDMATASMRSKDMMTSFLKMMLNQGFGIEMSELE